MSLVPFAIGCPSDVPASERKSGLKADRLAAVAVGLWRTATKKPDGLPKGSRWLVSI